MLTPKDKEWHDRRRKGIGGSDATTLMSGDPEKIYRLWELKTGKREPDNLDDVFEVALGTYTEPFNREWFFRVTMMPVIAANDFRVRKDVAWQVANIDGEVLLHGGGSAVFEAKHTHSHGGMKSALARYQPQLHHNMMVCGLKKAYLSVIMGNSYDYVEVDFDAEYAAALHEVEKEFWDCVSLGMPPSGTPVIVEPPQATKALDMTGHNEWASLAADWLANKGPADAFERSAKALKLLVPSDAKIASGHGVKISRDKRRALRISQDSSEE